jgi:hypothetical protein
MLKEDENTKQIKTTCVNTEISWISFSRKYRDCEIHIDQYDKNWILNKTIEDGAVVDAVIVPRGICNIRVDGPNGLKEWRFEIEEDKINQAANEIIDGWLNVEKEYVAYVDAICEDSVVGNEQTIPYIPDDPSTWTEHEDAELKCSKIPDDVARKAAGGFETYQK